MSILGLISSILLPLSAGAARDLAAARRYASQCTVHRVPLHGDLYKSSNKAGRGARIVGTETAGDFLFPWEPTRNRAAAGLRASHAILMRGSARFLSAERTQTRARGVARRAESLTPRWDSESTKATSFTSELFRKEYLAASMDLGGSRVRRSPTVYPLMRKFSRARRSVRTPRRGSLGAGTEQRRFPRIERSRGD